MEFIKSQYRWSDYLNLVTTEFNKEQFNEGKLHGQMGWDNNNIGHICQASLEDV